MKIDTTSGDFDYTYLSLGAGVQSSALLVLACTDDRVPTPDVAIFADTGDEPKWVYEYVRVLTAWAAQYGVEVVTVTAGVLSEKCLDGTTRGSLYLPVFTDGGSGMLNRTCTHKYKIVPLHREVRKRLGYRKGQVIKKRARSMLGISADEVTRMKVSHEKWQTNTYPLVDLGIRREHCYDIVAKVGLPRPERSACVYCPFHSDSYWQWLKDEHPDEFEVAVKFDHAMRGSGRDKGLRSEPFLHRSCKPLDQVEFVDKSQVNLFSIAECEGMCGV